MASPSLDHVIVQLDLDRVQSYTGPSSSTCYIYRLVGRLPFNWPRPLGPDRLPHSQRKQVEPLDLSSERTGTTQTLSFPPHSFDSFFSFGPLSSGICPSHFAPKSWKPDKRDMAGVEGTKMKEPPAAEQDRVDIFRVTEVKNGTETRKLQQKWSNTWQLNGSIADCSHKSPLFDYKTADRFLLLCLLVLMCGASTRFRS